MINVKMRGSSEEFEATISVQQDLIMLHAPCISAQWPMFGTGVELSHQGSGICKLAFMVGGQMHQGFYFNADCFQAIDRFFKGHGFPMPKPINDNWIKENA